MEELELTLGVLVNTNVEELETTLSVEELEPTLGALVNTNVEELETTLGDLVMPIWKNLS